MLLGMISYYNLVRDVECKSESLLLIESGFEICVFILCVSISILCVNVCDRNRTKKKRIFQKFWV